MPGGSGQLDAAVPPGPKDGPLHPSPQESGQIQDLEIPRNSTTPMSSFTRIDVTSEVKAELSASSLSSENLDRTEDGFSVLGSLAKKTEKNHDLG